MNSSKETQQFLNNLVHYYSKDSPDERQKPEPPSEDVRLEVSALIPNVMAMIYTTVKGNHDSLQLTPTLEAKAVIAEMMSEVYDLADRPINPAERKQLIQQLVRKYMLNDQ